MRLFMEIVTTPAQFAVLLTVGQPPVPLVEVVVDEPVGPVAVVEPPVEELVALKLELELGPVVVGEPPDPSGAPGSRPSICWQHKTAPRDTAAATGTAILEAAWRIEAPPARPSFNGQRERPGIERAPSFGW
jgi:hypothetical protein